MKLDPEDPKFREAIKQHQETKIPPEYDKLILQNLHRASVNKSNKHNYALAIVVSFSLAAIVVFGYWFVSSTFVSTNSYQSFQKNTDFKTITNTFKQSKSNVIASKNSKQKLKTIVPSSTIIQVRKSSKNTKITQITKYSFGKSDFSLKHFNQGSKLAFDDKITVKILNKSSVKKLAPYKYQIISGKIKFDVKHIKSNHPILIKSNKGTIQIIGTKFILTVTSKYSAINLIEGKVKITTPYKQVVLNSGHSFKWFESPKLTEKQILTKLASYKQKHQHRKAIKFINSVLPYISSSLEESLILDKISIKAALLNKWDDACKDLKKYLKKYPHSKYRKSALFIWNRYRCTD